MTKTRSTKSALISSVIALLLCFTMLLGSTFAWFTDSVTSANNIIKSGNLDIELEYAKVVDGDITEWNTVAGKDNIFDKNALWEPGRVEVVYLKVSNLGTLALKYQLGVNIVNEIGGKNVAGEDFKLSDHLVFKVVDLATEPDTAYTREEAVAAAGNVKGLKDYNSVTTALEVGGTDYVALIVYMPENIGNEANYRGDAIPTIELGINLYATQQMEESDSFGNNYDEFAGLPWTGKTEAVPEAVDGVITITNAEQFAGFAAAVNSGNTYSGKTIKLAADINLGNRLWTPIGQTGPTQFVGSFDGNGHTIYNLNIDNTANTSQYGAAGLFGWVEHHSGSNSIKDLTIDGVTINSHRYSGAIAGWINIPVTNCIVKNVTINCSYYNDDTDGTKVGALVGYADNGSALTNNTVDTAVLNAFGDVGGLAGVAQTTVSVTGNTVKNVAINYVSVTKSNPGEIVSTRITPVMGTNTAENVIMTRSINVTSTALLNKELAGLSGNALSTAAILSNCNEPDAIINLPAGYTGILTIKDSTIKSVQAAGNANIVIVGDVVVNANGSGVATVADTATTFDGSAITANGELNISGTGNLTAIAADVKAAFGIGGMNVSKLNISNVHIVKATGAVVDSKIGTDYGKQDFEGAPAIGSGYVGAEITLNNVTVDEALGGSKSAGIGARYHTGVTINIVDSVIKNVVGGSSSAGIGGSRMTKHMSGDLQNVTINITNSTVNATGGDFGAGIGSGYNTYCSGVTPAPVIAVTIDADSIITAQGGWLGAGIGTGHNALGFVGNIACDTSNVKAGSSEDPSWCCWGNPCTTAENIGLGVLSVKNFPDKFGKFVTNADELDAAVANGGDVVMANDITLTGKVITTNGITEAYGNKVGVAQYGGTLDGNGNSLTETGKYAYVIVTHGGTIKNINIVGGGRGIVIYAPTEDVIIDNVVIDGPGYAINTAEHNGQDLIVTNSTIKGWTSLAGLDSVSFTGCLFGENSTKCWQNSGYGADYDRLIRPYGQASFTDCTFEKNFYIDLSSLANGNTVTLTNCNCEGVVLTAENYANYITVELPDWATSIADCIVFN